MNVDFFKLEFYLDGANRNIIIHDLGKNEHFIFDENSHLIINYVYDKIKSDYPEAYKTLRELYYPGAFHKFRMVSRFIRCNFSVNDHQPDIDDYGAFILEHVPCPLRNSDFCPWSNIICNPSLTQIISDREKDIAVLLADGFSPDEVADKLFISPATVKNHRFNIYKKLNIHSVADLLRHCHKQNWL